MFELLLCATLLQAGDPHAAYRDKNYEQALQGFLDMQVNHPDDPELMLNVGSTYYQLKDYPQAEKAFAQALAAAGDNLSLRQAAAYDLGNTAFHQGKLEEAVQRYRESLAVNSNDVDTRHNLQLAEAEMQRRKQEAQKQQSQRDEQKQQQQDSQQPGEPQKPDDDSKPGEPKPQDGQQPKPPEPKAGQDKPAGQNDPQKPPEAQPGQQQPSQPGDKPDASQQGADKPAEDKKAAGEKAAGADKRGKQGPVLSPEQAERYLQSVGESRPKKHLRGKQVQRMPNGKDW